MRSIVENKLSSALIMEEDSDWDVNLKAQMTEFARGAHIIQGVQRTTFSPYGDNWDMLWLGHCGNRAFGEDREENRMIYAIPDDPTVTPPHYRTDFVHPRLSDKPGFESHRLVFVGEGPICSWSVAFTYDGARKALAALSMVGLDQPVDLGYNSLWSGLLCMPYSCLSTYPSLMGTWAQTGPAVRDSDIVDTDSKDWHEASSNRLVYSTMLNMGAFVNNSTRMKAQWKDVRQPEIDLKTMRIPNGYVYTPDLPPHDQFLKEVVGVGNIGG